MEEENKVVLKTAGLTVAALLIVTVLVISAFALFCPSLSGDFCYRIGLDGLSVRFARVAYDKSGEIDDVAVLIERAASVNDDETIVEYAPELLKHKNWSEYEEFMTEKLQYQYGNFINGKYAVALYRKGDKAEALNVAKSATEEYGVNNPMQHLVSAVAAAKDSTFAADVLVVLEEMFQSAKTTATAKAVAVDGVQMATISGNQTAIGIWKARYDVPVINN